MATSKWTSAQQKADKNYLADEAHARRKKLNSYKSAAKRYIELSDNVQELTEYMEIQQALFEKRLKELTVTDTEQLDNDK
ncbi:hypothetical protein EQG49_00080 [Periweissella cryptocerci]|uniref:Uncharacterized protein n=1 Tax=Periweissella cryptocerci TaxID=2506420 RepID=A0A4P6YQS3_9LACO|nr:hypothetical protein [Periweissella cryptocerci]QBO34951.1 hypothetical protein EQG49_00080 [Periweissella cryptocerci]